MKDLRWSQLKSERLKMARGVSFEEIVSAELVSIKAHPKRPDQNTMLFKLKGLYILKDTIFKQEVYKTL